MKEYCGISLSKLYVVYVKLQCIRWNWRMRSPCTWCGGAEFLCAEVPMFSKVIVDKPTERLVYGFWRWYLTVLYFITSIFFLERSLCVELLLIPFIEYIGKIQCQKGKSLNSCGLLVFVDSELNDHTGFSVSHWREVSSSSVLLFTFLGAGDSAFSLWLLLLTTRAELSVPGLSPPPPLTALHLWSHWYTRENVPTRKCLFYLLVIFIFYSRIRQHFILRRAMYPPLIWQYCRSSPGPCRCLASTLPLSYTFRPPESPFKHILLFIPHWPPVIQKSLIGELEVKGNVLIYKTCPILTRRIISSNPNHLYLIKSRKNNHCLEVS